MEGKISQVAWADKSATTVELAPGRTSGDEAATAPGARGYTDRMQLRNARVCLDCEEVHDAQQCPLCASETFAFISRWVPAPERRSRPRAPEPPRPEELQAYREMLDPAAAKASGWKLVQRGAVGLALFGVAGWLWKSGNSERGPKSVSSGRTET